MAGPDARRVRRGADRAGRPVEHRAVGRVAAVPAVALDAALEALALRDADETHELARLELLHRERLSHLVALELLGLLEPDLADDPHRGDVRLLEEARLGLGHVLLLGAKAELERVVAMGVLGPDPHDRAWPRLDDGHGHLVAVVAEDLGHTDLAADEPLLARHQLIRRGPRRPRPSPPLGEAAATDFGTHRFDTLHQVMGVDAPLGVTASGGRFALKDRSEEHTSELQSRLHLVCRLLLE